MKLVSFSRESLNVKSSVWSDLLSSKLKYFLLFALCHVFMSQSVSAISGCSWSSYSNLDEVSWDPENGVIHYKIRAYQTWGGEGNARCCWGVDGDPLTLTQKSSTTHVIKILTDEDGKDNGSTIDGRKLQYGVSTEKAPSAQGGSDESTRFYVFDVPVSQADLGKPITISLKGHWWKKGGVGEGVDENYDEPNFRQVTLTYPADPGLQITKVYYDCAQTTTGKSAPVIYFDWKRNNSSAWIATEGAVFLCEGGSTEQTKNAGSTARYAKTEPSPFYVGVTTEDGDYHNTNNYYTYKLRHELELQIEANGIQSNILYAFESNTVEVNAYSQVSYVNVEEKSEGTFFVWKIPSAPTTHYDNSPFIVTMTRTTETDTTEEKMEFPYEPGVTDYSYKIPTYVGTVNYLFSVGRGTTKDLECFDVFKRKLSVSMAYGDHAYPDAPKVQVSPDQSTAVITWEKTGKMWTEGTQFVLSRTDLTTLTTSEDTLSREVFVKGAYVDSVDFCSSYAYKLILIPGRGAEKKVLIVGEITTGGCPSVFLTLYDGSNGKTDILIDQCNTFKAGFVPDEGWVIESVSYNGADVTDQLQDGYYNTPEVTENSTLSVVYKQKILTDAPMTANTSTHVWTSDRQVVIGNAQIGTEVVVMDLMGRLVYSGKVDSDKMTIDALGSGIFIVRVGTEVFKVSL